MDFDFDLFVIGGGSGGVRAARIAAEHGARVGLAEEFRWGGTCVIRGCVPKKLMAYARDFRDAFEDARGFGWTSAAVPDFDWAAFMAAKEVEITRLEGAYRDRLDRTGVRLFDARATIADAHAVRLATGERLTTRHILVATGGTPFVPDIPGAGLGITSNELLSLPAQPRRIAVIGGGYIACEFASILNGLGSETHLVYRGSQILRGFDDDLRAHAAAAMAARGVRIRLGAEPAALEEGAEGLRLRLDDGAVLAVDAVLFATGRRPNSQGLGLEALGIALGRSGAIPVDGWSQTAVPSVYAVGDVTDRLALTPIAIREGHAFADTVFGARPVRVDHDLVPTAVFTRPELASVGLTEAEARAAGPVLVYRTSFRPMQNVLAGRDERMLMKLVVAAEGGRVLGCHIAGPGAAEMIQLAAIALRMGATKADFDRTVALHPTAAEELVTLATPVASAA